jgi:hypothetical protein
MDDFKAAKAKALQRIADQNLLEVEGERCQIGLWNGRWKAYLEFKQRNFRRLDTQSWHGFGMFFCVTDQDKDPLPAYGEFYLSYPEGEIAIRRPVPPDVPYTQMRLFLLSSEQIDAFHLREGITAGLNALALLRRQDQRLTLIQDASYRQYIKKNGSDETFNAMIDLNVYV